MSFIEKNSLKISSILFNFINNEVIPGTGIDSDKFWNSFEKTVHELAPINKKLIQKREDIQKKIDEWHKKNKGKEPPVFLSTHPSSEKRIENLNNWIDEVIVKYPPIKT